MIEKIINRIKFAWVMHRKKFLIAAIADTVMTLYVIYIVFFS